MPDESTTKINIDISELRKNIQEANRLIRVANSEFKASSASMDDWAGSADGISTKLTQLNKVLKSQETILDALEQQYNAVAAEQGENSKGAQELLIKVNNQKAAIAKTNSEIKKWEKALDEVDSSSESVTKETKNLDNAIDDAEDSIKSISDGFTVMKGAMASLIADGIKSMISGFANLAGETREYREDMGKLQTAFEEGGFTAQAATDVYKDFYAVLGEEDRSVEAVNHLAKMVDTEKDLATWTDIATGVWGTFGDSLPIEGLTEAANETAKVGTLTGSLADALNWAGVNEETFQKQLDDCNSEQERSQLIMDTLNGLYSDAADKYRENNAEVMAARDAQSNLTDAYAKFGEMAEPIISVVKQGVADLLNEILNMTGNTDFSGVAESVKDGFSYLIDTVLPAVKEGFQWIIDNKDILIAGVAGITAGFVAWKAVGVAQMVHGMIVKLIALVTAQEGATVAQKLLNLAMKANPIGIVITVITALVTAFITLWNTSDKFRAFWINLWKKIKEIAKDAWKAITGFFSDAWKKIKEIWGKAKQWFKDIWAGIKNIFSNVKTWFSDMFKKAWTGVKNAWSSAKSWFSNLWSGIKNVFSKVSSWFGDVFGNAWKAIKNKFSEWGSFWSGLWTKIKNKFSDIGSNVGSAISDAVKAGINKVLSTIESTINKGIKLINSAIGVVNKLPGVDVSTVPLLSLPRLERGGVLKKGQVGILEGNGAEAVVPLDKNKLWIRKTAKTMMNELQNQGIQGIGGVSQSRQVTQNFYQYNTSPKALSRLEIYRQTKNQLTFAKGV